MKAFKRIFLIMDIVMAVVILFITAVHFMPAEVKELSDAEKSGRAFIDRLESRDVGEVEMLRSENRREKIKAERDARVQKLLSGETDVWTLFEDYAIMGDSRAVGFYYHDFLPDDRVIADGGWTIRDIEPNLDSVKAVSPDHIYLCFGLNDVSIGYWDTPEEYVKEFAEILDRVQKELPGVTFYINSILPATDPAFDVMSEWREIPNFSEAVRKMCREKGIPFVDCDELMKEHADLYDIDGIHVKKEFYQYWAANMITTWYDVEAGLYEDTIEADGKEKHGTKGTDTGKEDGNKDDTEAGGENGTTEGE